MWPRPRVLSPVECLNQRHVLPEGRQHRLDTRLRRRQRARQLCLQRFQLCQLLLPLRRNAGVYACQGRPVGDDALGRERAAICRQCAAQRVHTRTTGISDTWSL